MMELIEWYFLSGALSVWEMDVNNWGLTLFKIFMTFLLYVWFVDHTLPWYREKREQKENWK